MTEIHTVLPRDSVQIITTGRDDGMLSVQIPVRLILATDDVMRWMRDKGLTLTIGLVNSEDQRAVMKWQACCGGCEGDGPTPWSAVEALAKQLERQSR